MAGKDHPVQNKGSNFPPQDWSIYGYGLLGSARLVHSGGGLEVVRCFQIEKNDCLEAGLGLSITGALGPEKDTYVTSSGTVRILGPEVISSPLIRMGYLHFPTPHFGLGLTGNLGYSFISGFDERVNPTGVSEETYSGGGFMYQGLLTLQGRFTPMLGAHIDGGIKSLPGADISGVEDSRTTGFIGQAGLKLMF